MGAQRTCSLASVILAGRGEGLLAGIYFDEVPSDPPVLREFGTGASSGELTGTDVRGTGQLQIPLASS